MNNNLALLKTADPLMVIDQANLAESTKTQYRRALTRYFGETGADINDIDALTSHAATLPKSSRAFLKAVVKLHTQSLARAYKGQATAQNVNEVQAALYRIEALQDAVKVKQTVGKKVHTWLTLQQVEALFQTCEDDIFGQRDRVVLGLLVAAGLRREEVVNLRFEDVKVQPVKGSNQRFRTVLGVKGKGAKNRIVPISDALATAIREWSQVVSGVGCIARSWGMNRKPGLRIRGQGIFNIVAKRGAMIGKPELQPHGLRRTYAQLGYEAGIPITQISKVLGHSSIATTQRYLNLDLDLETTVSDVIPFTA